MEPGGVILKDHRHRAGSSRCSPYGVCGNRVAKGVRSRVRDGELPVVVSELSRDVAKVVARRTRSGSLTPCPH